MKNIFLIAAVIITIGSCEKTVTVSIPITPSKLVLNGVVQANNVFKTNVSKSEAVLSTNTTNSFKVNNATVVLFQNGVVKDTLLYNAPGNNYIAKNNTIAAVGNKYKLVASASGFTTVEAESTTPSAISIKSITKIENAKINANGDTLHEIKIKFDDNASENNYYLFKIKIPLYNNGAQIFYNPINCIYSNDIDIDKSSNADPANVNECIYREFTMADKNFKGNTKTLTVFINKQELQTYTNPFNQKKYKPIVEINSLEKNYYNYRRSKQSYLDNEDNPFSEAVLVFTNVKNGYGIFSTFSIGRDTIR